MQKCSNSADRQPPRHNARLIVDRLQAKCTLYRLAAALFALPLPETHAALQDGRIPQALSDAWARIHGGHELPALAVEDTSEEFESAYIDIFLHGRRGQPRVPLLAGDYSELLAGQTRPVYMLNIGAFYRHFGLKAAVGDEGRGDEPDHISAELELMAVLVHLESTALQKGKACDDYQRAQRDFLRRYLMPLCIEIRKHQQKVRALPLNATLVFLIESLPDFLEREASNLDVASGVFHQTGDGSSAGAPVATDHVVDQNLWG